MLKNSLILFSGIDGVKVERHEDDDAEPQQKHIFGFPSLVVLFLLVFEVKNGGLEIFDFVGEELDNGLVASRLAQGVDDLK